MVVGGEAPPLIARCQAIHNACFDYARSSLPREPLTITEWVHDRVPGGEIWEMTHKVPKGGREHSYILRIGEFSFEVDKLVTHYDSGAPLPDLWASCQNQQSNGQQPQQSSRQQPSS
jgi:hypothetical protein